MVECKFCKKRFFDDRDGLVGLTFHELLHDPEMVNK